VSEAHTYHGQHRAEDITLDLTVANLGRYYAHLANIARTTYVGHLGVPGRHEVSVDGYLTYSLCDGVGRPVGDLAGSMSERSVPGHDYSHQAEVWPGSGMLDICECGHEGDHAKHVAQLEHCHTHGHQWQRRVSGYLCAGCRVFSTEER